MKRKIIRTRSFTKESERFIQKRHLLSDDLDSFEKEVAESPEIGDLIPGTAGIRKARIKSATKGKSGGFRICYYHVAKDGRIYLLFIYPKNEKEDLNMQEKKILKEFVAFLKGAKNA